MQRVIVCTDTVNLIRRPMQFADPSFAVCDLQYLVLRRRISQRRVSP